MTGDGEGLRIHPEVIDALESDTPVVALESTIISHGLPRPDNLRVAREIEQTVRDHGGVPATIAMIDGKPCIGLFEEELRLIAESDAVVKLGVRDLGVAAAKGLHGATTVAATASLAAQADIDVFATGGLGGVHRQARDTWDESADLTALSRIPMAVVCAGVKSILDVPATLERLETLNVPVYGYRTNQFPGFYLTDSGYPLEWSFDFAEELADAVLQHWQLAWPAVSSGVLIANPIPVEDQIDPMLHDRILTDALAAAENGGVSGKDVTPFLLEFFHSETDGESLRANVLLVKRNAELATRIAAEIIAAAPSQ
ncbi:pseudouridine-5'-phosphate glycosidase [Catenulispora sp. NL8]|uniref:Pseudouridine-5'-phosphate glycosidase n=1 Tax=Catenulispora pinistramenti TaxID=2705254 RepID=A0ABS5L5R4_9ACTN|nr:pseudouridine-5'-phosphate glycosidase [Catenulispora pinistramenti]